MYDLVIYSLKVGACLAVFYLFFKLLLSRETFHRFNRIVVLGATILSFVLPLCVITIYREMPVLPEFAAEQAATIAAEPVAETFPWELMTAAIFLAGALVTLLWTLGSLLGVLRLVRGGRRERLACGAILVRSERPVTPFSWGRYVVISDKDLAENGEAILLHECAHLRLHHSLDLIVTDVAGCLQWFNPAMWLLRRELRAIHEYEADEAVLAGGVDAKNYQLLLIKKAAGGRWYSVANSFNHSKLKNRITMMLCKKSSRWAGAKVLLLLPLMGVAVGAFAQTAYVFPKDKGKKENITIRISGSDLSTQGIQGQPLVLVEGRRVTSLDSIPAEHIASISVLKDSVSRATYGDEAKDGVILVTLKKEGDAKQIPGLKGRVVKISGTNGTEGRETTDDATKADLSAGQSVKTFVMSSTDHSTITISDTGSNPVYVVDGVQVHSIDALEASQIERMTVITGNRLPQKYVDQGYAEVIEVTTKQVSAAQKATKENLEAGSAGIEVARKGLELARKHMDADTWKQAQQALDEAQKGLETAHKQTSAQFSEAQKTLDAIPQTAGRVDKVTIRDKTENKVSITKGRVTVNGAFPEGMLIYINGREATQADVDALKAGQIKRMIVYTGDNAVKRYGEKGRKGVVEIKARK